MKKINPKISNWIIMMTVLILTVGLANTFASASGRFNLPLSWILTPSGTSVDINNNGIIDNVDAGVPSGLIIIWSGSYDNIPSSWQLCDGTNGSPDLRDKFVYGVNTSYGSGNDGDLGTTGGVTTHSHTYSCVPEHGHNATISSNPHSHIYDKSNPKNQSNQYRDKYANHHYTSTNTSSVDLSVSIDTTGSTSCSTDDAGNLPSYYKLAYIMKL